MFRTTYGHFPSVNVNCSQNCGIYRVFVCIKIIQNLKDATNDVVCDATPPTGGCIFRLIVLLIFICFWNI